MTFIRDSQPSTGLLLSRAEAPFLLTYRICQSIFKTQSFQPLRKCGVNNVLADSLFVNFTFFSFHSNF